MTTTPDNSGGPPPVDHGFVGDPEVQAEIARRLAAITASGYEDPARKNLTAGDWIAFAGFLAACAIAFTVWGY